MQKTKRFIEIAPFVLVLGLALFLRIRHLDTTGIWGDQSFTLNTAMRWVNGGAMPLAANKSSGLSPGSIYLYPGTCRRAIIASLSRCIRGPRWNGST
jgi:hypothetical protein